MATMFLLAFLMSSKASFGQVCGEGCEVNEECCDSGCQVVVEFCDSDASCASGSCCQEVCGPVAEIGAGFMFRDVTVCQGIIPIQTSEGGVGHLISGPGVAAADFDGDGWIDMFIPQAGGVPDLLYHNLGDGSYEEIATELGLGSMFSGEAAVWIDFDNDGDLDLFVVDATPSSGCMFRLYRNNIDIHTIDCRTNEDLCFEDVICLPDATGECACPIGGSGKLGGIAVGDVNNDGYIDIYVALYDGINSAHLLVNKGADGTLGFEDMTAGSGLSDTLSERWQPIMADFNNDGWLDILQTQDGQSVPNTLWINERMKQPKFRAETCSQPGPDCTPLLSHLGTDMGIALGDYDNDGDLDVYTANIGPLLGIFQNEAAEPVAGGIGGLPGEIPAFTDQTTELLSGDSGWSWGATFMDADNDGFLDIAVTNGTNGQAEDDRTTILHNVSDGQGNRVFEEIGQGVGFSDRDMGVSLVAFDSDRDGDLDSMQTSNSKSDVGIAEGLLRLRHSYQCNANNYVVIKPRNFRPNANRFGIGAIVRVKRLDGSNEDEMMRIITAGTSFWGQEPAEAFFGLGDATLVDIVVEWPDDDTAPQTNGTIETTTLSNVFVANISDPIGYQSLVVCPPLAEGQLDCNNNTIDDGCDIANGISLDCNKNGIPDECDVDVLDPDDNGQVSEDCDGNGIPDECQSDCDNDGKPDSCAIADGDSDDCDTNSVPDECDIALDSSIDTANGGNGIPDRCEVDKQRYLTFAPGTSTVGLAYKVEMTAGPGAPLLLGWLSQPGDHRVSRVVSTPFHHPSGWPNSLHVGDCEIRPNETYEISSTLDGVVFDPPVVLSTHTIWGDVVGNPDAFGNWPPPQGIVNFNDVVAVLQGFQGDPNAPPLMWIDVAPETPNYWINFEDVFWVISAFGGNEYSINEPAGCPAQGSAPPPPVGNPALFTLVPSDPFIVAGESVAIDVYIGTMEELWGYQVALAVSGGTSGALVLTAATVNTAHTGYVFDGLSDVPTSDVPRNRVGNGLTGSAVGVPVSGSGYLATLTYVPSGSAAGVFVVSVVDQDKTFLANSSGHRLAHDVGSGAVIYVGIECLTDSDCDDGNDCTVDTCAANSCTHTDAASGTPCDDGLFCTKTDQCDGAGVCAGTGNPCKVQLPACCEQTRTCGQLPCW